MESRRRAYRRIQVGASPRASRYRLQADGTQLTRSAQLGRGQAGGVLKSLEARSWEGGRADGVFELLRIQQAPPPLTVTLRTN